MSSSYILLYMYNIELFAHDMCQSGLWGGERYSHNHIVRSCCILIYIHYACCTYNSIYNTYVYIMYFHKILAHWLCEANPNTSLHLANCGSAATAQGILYIKKIHPCVLCVCVYGILYKLLRVIPSLWISLKFEFLFICLYMHVYCITKPQINIYICSFIWRLYVCIC